MRSKLYDICMNIVQAAIIIGVALCSISIVVIIVALALAILGIIKLPS